MTAQELTIKVESALEEIRPYLISDGGNITLIEIVDNVVKVKLEGACGSCYNQSNDTYKRRRSNYKKKCPSNRKSN